MKRSVYLLVVFLLAVGAMAFVVSKTYMLNPETEFKVTGTSTLHDWHLVSSKAVGKASIEVDGNQITSISGLVIKLPAKSLKSGTSGMDDNTYKALKASEYPEIAFTMQDAKITQNAGGAAYITATGNLTIAGVTKNVMLKSTGKVSGEKILFEGKYDMKLTDFNIDPPTAMLGTIKTGNDVTVHFKLNF